MGYARIADKLRHHEVIILDGGTEVCVTLSVSTMRPVIAGGHRNVLVFVISEQDAVYPERDYFKSPEELVRKSRGWQLTNHTNKAGAPRRSAPSAS